MAKSINFGEYTFMKYGKVNNILAIFNFHLVYN